MMNYRSYAVVMLVGRLGQDAKIVQTKSGTKMLAFSVCTSVSVKSSDGSYSQRTTWHDCLFTAAKAEKMVSFMTKGTLISCQGQLSYREQELKNGYKGKTASIFVDDVQILAAGKTAETAHQPAAAKAPAAAAPAPAPAPAPKAEPAAPAADKPADKAATAAPTGSKDALDALEEDIPF